MKNIEDFLTDPEFIRWVNHPDKELGDYWNKWREANPEQLQSMKIAKEILDRAKFEMVKPPKGMKEEVIGEILRMKKIAIPENQTSILKRRVALTEYIWNGLGQMGRVAAILIASFGIVSFFLFPQMKEIEGVAIIREQLIQKSTSAGEKMQLTLGDGTKVWLNSSTQVEFPEKFNMHERRISLKGEAYFEVVHDSLRPFTVSTDGLLTTVLGTSFNINTKKSGRTQVALVSGKVVVTSAQKTYTMSPSELVDFDQSKTVFTVRKLNESEILAWKDGILRFKNASLVEVKSALEDWYGVEISLENARDVKWQFTGEYGQQTLEEVLMSISYIQKFDYRINDKSVTLSF